MGYPLYFLGFAWGALGLMQVFTMIGAEYYLSIGFKRYFVSSIELFLKINARALYRAVGFITLGYSLSFFAIGFAAEHQMVWLVCVLAKIQIIAGIEAHRYIHQEVQYGTRFHKS